MFKPGWLVAAVATFTLFTSAAAYAVPVSGISTTDYNEGTDTAAPFFNPLAVSAVNLTLPQASVDALNNNPYTSVYQRASVTITAADGKVTSLSNIGVRIKGQATRTNLYGKAPLKLKFDAFVSGQKFMGLTRMTLNSMVQDPSFIHEDTIYRLFRAMNVIAPRTTYSWVTLNGADFGLYMNVESVDNQMLKRWVTAKHLYSSNCYGADITPWRSGCYDTNYGDSDRSDLQAAINVSQYDGAQWWTEVNKVADMTEVINLMATDIYTSNWDGYTDVVQNNYFMVFDNSGKLRIIPWGEDGAFPQDPSAQGYWDGVGPAFRNWGSERSVMLRKCVAYDLCKTLLTKAEVAVKLKADQMNLPAFKNKVAAVINNAYISQETRANRNVNDAINNQNWLDYFFTYRNQSLADYLKLRAPEAPEVSISGTPLVGKALTATGSTFDFTSTIGYQWLRDSQPILNQNQSTYTLTFADDTHLISCLVTTNKTGFSPASTTTPALRVSSSRAPSASIVGNPAVGSTLVAKPEIDDITQVTYKWFRDGRSIAGATSGSYTPIAADLGKAITVTTTVSQAGFPKNITTSSPVVITVGRLSTPTISIDGNGLMATSLVSTVTADPGVKIAYQWLRDGVIINSASRSLYTIKADDTQHLISLKVTLSKLGYTTLIASSSSITASQGTIFSTPTPLIGGVATVGKTIIATPGSWDSGVKLTYQWLRNGVLIQGATSKSYKLSSADLGKAITVGATGTKAGYASVTKQSDPVIIN